MENPVILIDCDGVLADFDAMFIGLIRDQFGIDFNPTDYDEWDYFNHPDVVNIKSDVWDRLKQTKGLIRGIKKLPYAEEMIRKLREVGKVEACTSIVSGGTYADERIMWLIEELGFDRTDIHLSYRKYRVCGNVFIDDKPENVVKWADWWYNDGNLPVLWHTPGRAKYSLNDDRILCTGDVDEVIRKMEEEGLIR